MEITSIFGKFESYIHGSVGSRLVSVGRLAGLLADQNVILLEIYKIL